MKVASSGPVGNTQFHPWGFILAFAKPRHGDIALPPVPVDAVNGNAKKEETACPPLLLVDWLTFKFGRLGLAPIKVHIPTIDWGQSIGSDGGGGATSVTASEAEFVQLIYTERVMSLFTYYYWTLGSQTIFYYT